MSILETKDLTMRFGGVTAIDHLNMHINPREIVAIIGPNGAGKTTAFNMITGIYVPTQGQVFLADRVFEKPEQINGVRPDRIAKKGIARTFQNIRLFQSMTVLENVMIASHLNLKSNVFEATFHLPRYTKQARSAREEAMFLLEKVGLQDQTDVRATSLPYGQQRRLEIIRAMITHPRLLLLDEPAAGMNPTETQELTAFVSQIRDEFDLSILMIEHDMQIVMDISDRIYVLDFGKLIATGLPEEIKNNQLVIEAYLGVAKDAEG